MLNNKYPNSEASFSEDFITKIYQFILDWDNEIPGDPYIIASILFAIPIEHFKSWTRGLDWLTDVILEK
ncbi:MAG: hypothetical protein HQK83_00495 [Fibrobacteria bacterium]|nr:hypothetical protein [Fibrobacteria bacterium]